METRDIEAGISTLIELIPAWASTVVERACRQNLQTTSRPERSEFKINARPHSYGPNETKICEGARGALVFAALCRDGRCSAPTFSPAPIYTGKIEHLFPFNDLVVKLVDRANRTVYNVTLPQHIFFPGIVKLVVVENRTVTTVAVSGKGKGNWMLPNTRFGPLLFEAILKEHLVPPVRQLLQGAPKLAAGGGSSGGAGAGGRW